MLGVDVPALEQGSRAVPCSMNECFGVRFGTNVAHLFASSTGNVLYVHTSPRILRVGGEMSTCYQAVP
jgi:hypothetical protein